MSAFISVELFVHENLPVRFIVILGQILKRKGIDIGSPAAWRREKTRAAGSLAARGQSAKNSSDAARSIILMT